MRDLNEIHCRLKQDDWFQLRYFHQGSDGCLAVLESWSEEEYRIIASTGRNWDHVSVSLADRVATWEEMCMIKELFFNEEECVIQYHPPRSKYVNVHPNCLHLWKPQRHTIPMPPLSCI